MTRDLVGKRVASDLVTLLDVAHTFAGQEAMIPVHADDEGMPASEAIDSGATCLPSVRVGNLHFW